MAETPDRPAYNPSPEHWIEGVFTNRVTDAGLAADSFNPMASLMQSIVEGRSVGDQLSHEQSTDPGIIYKNLFLAKLAELADDPALHVGELLALLDRQAMERELPQETVHRQFMGLWDILVSVAKDEELMRFFRDRPVNY